MRLRQVLYKSRLSSLKELVGDKGVAHLLNLSRQPEHALASQNSRDLLKVQRVILNGQGSLDCAQAIVTTQSRRQIL